MFKKASFDVIESRRDLKISGNATCATGLRRQGARGGYAVVYFAGHGLEVDG